MTVITVHLQTVRRMVPLLFRGAVDFYHTQSQNTLSLSLGLLPHASPRRRPFMLFVTLPRYAPPSLREGELFRLGNLPRRIPDDGQPTGFRLARPGEKVRGLACPPAVVRVTPLLLR